MMPKESSSDRDIRRLPSTSFSPGQVGGAFHSYQEQTNRRLILHLNPVKPILLHMITISLLDYIFFGCCQSIIDIDAF